MFAILLKHLILFFITSTLAANLPVNVLSDQYTLCAHMPDNDLYDGCKVQNLALFREKCAEYCPTSVQNAGLCPHGVDMAFAGSLYPLSMVPGGQDLYVNADGSLAITVQHSHVIPSDAYPSHVGWHWFAAPLNQPRPRNCNRDDNMYNCDAVTGYWTFKAPGATVGGVKACTSIYSKTTTVIYAVTPKFNRTDCVDLLGLELITILAQVRRCGHTEYSARIEVKPFSIYGIRKND